MNKKLLITISIALFLLVATFVAINFARGYRFDFKKKKVAETGLLVANSFPTGAQVFINDKLTTATNDTLNLPPGDYWVKIVKDGYIPWEKALKLKKELVTQTNARLFPAAPDLKGLTSAGALNLTPSPDGEKIAFVVASASAAPKNGLWVLDLTPRPLSFSRGPRQIARNIPSFQFTQTKFIWSPNSKQVLAWSDKNSFLLDVDRFNDLSTQLDVTARLPLILFDWEEQLALKRKEEMKKLPEFMEEIVTQSAKNIYFSPDEERLLYTATASATLPEGLVPPLPASNTQPQTRMIEPNKIYVYDIKEDKNFYITEAKPTSTPGVDKETLGVESDDKKVEIEKRLEAIQNQYSPLAVQPIQWFPSSRHLILVENEKIIILEYDGTNRATVYAGPFENSFAYPWPDGSKLLILTNLNPDSPLPPNLYAIDLK